jgi:putative membrane protein
VTFPKHTPALAGQRTTGSVPTDEEAPVAHERWKRRELPAVVRPPRRDVGEDPDPRFSMANERTFLSWIRTALALDAAGLAVIQLLPELVVPYAREAIAITLVVIGTIVASASFRRWAAVEDAMRSSRPLPPSWVPGFLAATLGTLSLVTVLLLVVAQR